MLRWPEQSDNSAMYSGSKVFTRKRIGCILAGFVLAMTAALLAKEFQLPKPEAAATYPAHDNHATEQVAIAAAPYTGEKASIFQMDYYGHDLLPIYVVVTNDGGSSISLSNIQVQLVTVNRRAKIEPASDEDIYRRLSRIQHRGDEPSRNPLPIPLPRGGPKVGVKKDVAKEVEAAKFRARAVEPKTTQAGFMFFDVSDIRDPLNGATLFVTGVRDAGGKELMYFEIPLDKAAK